MVSKKNNTIRIFDFRSQFFFTAPQKSLHLLKTHQNEAKPSKPSYLRLKLANFSPKLENFSQNWKTFPVGTSRVAGWAPGFAHMFTPRVLPILRVWADSEHYKCVWIHFIAVQNVVMGFRIRPDDGQVWSCMIKQKHMILEDRPDY